MKTSPVWKLDTVLYYVLTPLSRILLEELTGSQPVKKFPSFCGPWRFITAFTGAYRPSLSWTRSIQSMSPSYLLKVHFNIIFPSTPGSSKWLLSLRFPHQNRIFCAELRWKFAFDGTWRLYRVQVVAMFAQKSRYNCKDESSFACRAHLSRSYSQHSTRKMHSILPYDTLQQRALLHVSSHKGSSSGRKYQIIVHKT
jgi:hypothetical protein